MIPPIPASAGAARLSRVGDRDPLAEILYLTNLDDAPPPALDHPWQECANVAQRSDVVSDHLSANTSDIPHLRHKQVDEPDRLVGGIAPRVTSCLKDNPVSGLKNDVTFVQAQHNPRVDGDDEVDGSSRMEPVTVHAVQGLVDPLRRRACPRRQFGKRPGRSARDRLEGGERLPCDSCSTHLAVSAGSSCQSKPRSTWPSSTTYERFSMLGATTTLRTSSPLTTTPGHPLRRDCSSSACVPVDV